MTTSQTSPKPVAWSDDELATNPHAHAEKAGKVRGMFGAIAGHYDLNNRLHSFGRDQAWRKFAVRRADLKATDRVLDVACGTGDLTKAFADALAKLGRKKEGDQAPVVGLDFTPEMLDVARERKATALTEYVEGDAMDLPFEDGSFDVVSIAFGIRNVSRPEAALSEFRRVLRPGGRLIILEFGKPGFAPIRWGNDFYCNVIMPRTATLISRDKSGAYKYLPRSVETFLTKDQMIERMQGAGFGAVEAKGLTFGVCVCYRGQVKA
jgi:demethylmenaquinone methyltransferase/2-methoxy-6-polyprenyl-1,4-benzoquinol methylase